MFVGPLYHNAEYIPECELQVAAFFMHIESGSFCGFAAFE